MMVQFLDRLIARRLPNDFDLGVDHLKEARKHGLQAHVVLKDEHLSTRGQGWLPRDHPSGEVLSILFIPVLHTRLLTHQTTAAVSGWNDREIKLLRC
jgi:hypothetical protein